MNITENQHEIDSVNALLNIIDGSLYNGRSRWIYRGHSNSSYKLQPSVGRLLKEKFSSPDELYRYEKDIFNEFFIRNYSRFRESNKLINLAIAQHHGLQTRLLDWTYSPLIALFFAIENELHHKEDGALHAYQQGQGYNQYPPKFENNPLEEDSYKDSDYYFVYAPDLTPRISNQHGIFQIFKEPVKEFKEAYNLHKIIIKAQAKSKIKKNLFRLGISYDTIYPDLDGLAKSIIYNNIKGNHQW